MAVERAEQAGVRELTRAADELYAAPLADFVPTRTRLVKQARSEKDRERARQLQAMRKPTVAAWLVNQVARRHPETVARMRDVGARMRHAQASLDAQGLADLRGERDEALTRLRDAAGEVAQDSGQPMTGTTADEVRETGVAALADASAEEAAWSGTLTRALSYSGFGEVDISDAVVRTGTGTVLRRLDGGAGEESEAEPKPEPQPEPEPEPEPEAEPEPEPEPEPESVPEEDSPLARVLTRLRHTAEELHEQVAVLNGRTEQARERLAEQEQQVADAEAALAAAQQRLEQAATERDEAATELAGLEREQQDLRAQHAAAQDEVTATEQALGGRG